MDNAAFWNERYRCNLHLGSGPGSRGYAAFYKNKLIKEIIFRFDIKSIVDIGCGDLCWLDKPIVESASYMGIDISTAAIDLARRAWPSLKFAVHDVSSMSV